MLKTYDKLSKYVKNLNSSNDLIVARQLYYEK